jgi:hypothetical protein
MIVDSEQYDLYIDIVVWWSFGLIINRWNLLVGSMPLIYSLIVKINIYHNRFECDCDYDSDSDRYHRIEEFDSPAVSRLGNVFNGQS